MPRKNARIEWIIYIFNHRLVNTGVVTMVMEIMFFYYSLNTLLLTCSYLNIVVIGIPSSQAKYGCLQKGAMLCLGMRPQANENR